LKNFNLNPVGRASPRTYCSSGIGLLSERGTAIALTDQAAQRQARYSIPGVAINANLSPDLTPSEYLHLSSFLSEIQVHTVLQSACQILRLLKYGFVIITCQICPCFVQQNIFGKFFGNFLNISYFQKLHGSKNSGSLVFLR